MPNTSLASNGHHAGQFDEILKFGCHHCIFESRSGVGGYVGALGIIKPISRFAHYLPLVLMAALLITGCAHSPLMSQTDAIGLASQAGIRAGYKLTDFKAPEAHYEFTRKDRTWSVFFDGKVPVPGNHFLVWVDDNTGKTEVIPGR